MDDYAGSKWGSCGKPVKRGGAGKCPHCGVHLVGEKIQYTYKQAPYTRVSGPEKKVWEITLIIDILIFIFLMTGIFGVNFVGLFVSLVLTAIFTLPIVFVVMILVE